MAKTPTFAVKSLADFNRPAIDSEWYKHINYQDAIDLIKDNITKAAESFVGIGYYLRFVKEHGLYKEGGYNNIYEFSYHEFGISQGTTSRYIKMNERFSRKGNSPLLDDKFADFGKSQLQELLSVKDDEALTEAIENRSITPDMTVTEIRQSIKAANDQSETLKLEQDIEEDIPGQMIIEDFPEYLPDKSLNEDSHDREQRVEEKKSIIDGEYREIEEKKDEIPELPLLKNNDQRKEWLEKYKDWGLWYHDEHIDVNYYKYDFNDGSRLVVTEYPQRHCYWKKGKEDQYYYHLLEKRYKGYGDIVYDRQYNNSTDSETYLVNFLKNLQKGDKKA